MPQGRVNSNSKKLRIRSTAATPTGRIAESRLLHNNRDIGESIARSNAQRRQSSYLQSLSSLDIPDNPTDDHYDNFLDDFRLNNVLDGSTSLDISHAGGEFESILAECYNEEVGKRRRQKDHRTRRDRTENRTKAFLPQLKGMTDAYIEWASALGDSMFEEGPQSSQEGVVAGLVKLRVMDTYRTFSYSADIYQDDPNLLAAIVRHGLIPTAPLKPSFTFSTRVLELYRVSHLRCPHLSIEPFVKSICDVHRLPFRPYLSQQFSIAVDVYLAIRANVKNRVDAALSRNVPNWRLKNACSACTYKLEGEGDLVFKMLVTMDGNDSLKRLRCASKVIPIDDDDSETRRLGESRARQDSRNVPGDYYLTRDAVDRWAKATLGELLPEDQEDVEDNPCAGRWSNMIHEVTAKMWGIFDETGVFLALCRHGFALVIADMVQSGELSKYPTAVVAALLEAFGEDIGGGYDIGCKFKTTLDQSELGHRAREMRYRSLVGSFHGHAHNRICQLSHLATYVKGMGLEDLEGCERFFSKSNHLAPSIRHATPFHRQQKIVEYLAHMDAFETGQNISLFLVNNYRQALELLAGQDALHKTMLDQSISSTEVFHQWLEEERSYLISLAQEPIQETMEMEYYQKLVNLHDATTKLDQQKTTWHAYDPNDARSTGKKRQSNPETKLRHAREAADRCFTVVQEIEVQMGILERWTPQCAEWKAAAVMVGRRRYQRCLDELERLVVSRMFELTKMNMSQTGYKLRKHIAKALKARSQAIRTALERYNAAAALMSPPRPPLAWDQVVEYAFLADFDLLRDCRQDVRERPWARPAARLAMDQYFKMQRAREEIQRLNIEIKRVMTHMRDEETFLAAKVREVGVEDTALAYQIQLYSEERTRFYDMHRRRFKKLAANPHFTGSLAVGTPIDKSLLIPNAMDIETEAHDEPEGQDEDEDEDEDEEEEEGNEEEGAGLLVEALEAFTIAAH